MNAATRSLGPDVVVRVAGLSDVGQQRKHNEDSLLVADLTPDSWSGEMVPPVRAFEESEDIEASVRGRGFLFIVADGMGGARAGEVASGMAVSGVYDLMAREWRPEEGAPFAEMLSRSVRVTGARIHDSALRTPDYKGMGTTATAVGVLNGVLYAAQVGDSRAYLVREATAYQLTRDQSVVEHLVRTGKLSAEQALRSRSKNILLQALGTVRDVEVDVSFQELRRGDRILVCSDGLTGLAEDEEIADLISSAAVPAEACKALVDLANARGGHDNITLIVAFLEGEGLPAANPSDAVGYRAYPAA